MKKSINTTWAYIGGLILGVLIFVYIPERIEQSKSVTNKVTNLAAAFCSEVNDRFAQYNNPIYASVSCEPIDSSYVNINYKLRPDIDFVERNKVKLNFRNEMARDPRLKRICQIRREGGGSDLFKNFKMDYNVYDNDGEFLVSYKFDTSKCTEQYATKQSQTPEL